MGRLVPPRALLFASLVVGLALPLSSALADPSIDAATQASQVNQEECANVHTLKHNVSAAGMQRVVKVWAEVGRVYEDEGKASYLLFWRGVLAQCLGRDELAILDLETFILSQKGQSLFVALVRQAKTRLKRLRQVRAVVASQGRVRGGGLLWSCDGGSGSGLPRQRAGRGQRCRAADQQCLCGRQRQQQPNR